MIVPLLLTVNSLLGQIMRFFSNPRKPMILALARPDPKKNLVTLVKAFGECRPLRELANLVRSTVNSSHNPDFLEVNSLFFVLSDSLFDCRHS